MNIKKRAGCLFWTVVILIFGSCSEKQADLVVWNAQILTVDDEFSKAEALAISDGKFVEVGTRDEVQPLVGDRTQVIDAQGKTVIPGLIESHVQAKRAATNEVQQPYVQLGSIAEIQEYLRDKVEQTPDGEWIQLPRADVTRIEEGRIPNSEEINEAAPGHPAVFTWQFADQQTHVLNTAAMEAADITAETTPPEGGTIHLGDDGQPTGVLENSGELIARFMERPEVSQAYYMRYLEELLHLYNEVGITSIIERNSSPEGFREFEMLKQDENLPVRVTVTMRIDPDGTVEDTERIIEELPVQFGDGDDLLSVGPLMIQADGGILYGSAYMREPFGEKAAEFYGFDDPDHRGVLQLESGELENIFQTGHRLGWQLAVHVTGDGGVDTVLDALEMTNANLPDEDRRFTLIHAYFPNREAAERAQRLGAVVDTQPAWYYKDGDALADPLGLDRLQRFIGLQTWRRAGVNVAINSDHMMGFEPNTSLNPYNPFLTMYTAITRRTEGGNVFGPDQQVSREEALRMMTIDAAQLSYKEDRIGSIEVGKLGDFTILSNDFLTCDENEIKDIKSLLTVVGGEVVYNRGTF